MKIVIDINKRLYTDIRDSWSITIGSKNTIDKLIKAIKNGIPLPKGHGRLVDISEYEKYFNTAITYDDGNHNHVVYTNMIPTIIEADRGE